MGDTTEITLSWKVILSPLAVVAIVLLPLLETALEIEMMQSKTIPIHWRFFISALIGGVLGALVEILRKIFNIDKQKEVEAKKIIQHQIDILERDQKIKERDIFITAYQLNEEWLKLNQQIADKKDALEKITTKTEWHDSQGNLTSDPPK